MREVGAELSDIYQGYQKIVKHLPEIEQESFTCTGEPFDPEDRWTAEGFVRNILDITFDPYWKTRVKDVPEEVVVHRNKWKKVIN